MDHKRSALTAVVIPLTCVTLVAVGASACGDSDGLNPPLGVPETTESSSYRIGGDELLGDSQSGRTPTVTAPLAPGAPMTGVATTPAVPPPPGAPMTEVATTPMAPIAERRTRSLFSRSFRYQKRSVSATANPATATATDQKSLLPPT